MFTSDLSDLSVSLNLRTGGKRQMDGVTIGSPFHGYFYNLLQLAIGISLLSPVFYSYVLELLPKM